MSVKEEVSSDSYGEVVAVMAICWVVILIVSGITLAGISSGQRNHRRGMVEAHNIAANHNQLFSELNTKNFTPDTIGQLADTLSPALTGDLVAQNYSSQQIPGDVSYDINECVVGPSYTDVSNCVNAGPLSPVFLTELETFKSKGLDAVLVKVPDYPGRQHHELTLYSLPVLVFYPTVILLIGWCLLAVGWADLATSEKYATLALNGHATECKVWIRIFCPGLLGWPVIRLIAVRLYRTGGWIGDRVDRAQQNKRQAKLYAENEYASELILAHKRLARLDDMPTTTNVCAARRDTLALIDKLVEYPTKKSVTVTKSAVDDIMFENAIMTERLKAKQQAQEVLQQQGDM